MNILMIIDKKKNKQELKSEEIEFVISNFTLGLIPDYQMSSFLMAGFINGFSENEIRFLTLSMIKSGDEIDLTSIEGHKLDKHSTGGVGDKVSLVLAPILASCGANVAKMSGRGLSFTGGTIDKLESIPGFKVLLETNEFIEQVKKIGISIVSQTDNLVPADKKIYALRDVTGTVDSLPYIASSIMSKKIATGSTDILLDIKCGNGAFMQNLDDARKLGKEMIKIGKMFDRNIRVEITNMSQPLGTMIGNKNEIIETIETLKGRGDDKFNELIFSSAFELLQMAEIVETQEEAHKMIDDVIASGKALQKFYEFVEAQGGDVAKIQEKDFWNPKYKIEIKADSEGYLEITDAKTFGLIAVDLGAGRNTKEDILDFEAGIELNKKTNDFVKEGETIFTLFSSNEISTKLQETIKKAYKISKIKVNNNIVLEKLR